MGDGSGLPIGGRRGEARPKQGNVAYQNVAIRRNQHRASHRLGQRLVEAGQIEVSAEVIDRLGRIAHLFLDVVDHRALGQDHLARPDGA